MVCGISASLIPESLARAPTWLSRPAQQGSMSHAVLRNRYCRSGLVRRGLEHLRAAARILPAQTRGVERADERFSRGVDAAHDRSRDAHGGHADHGGAAEWNRILRLHVA